MSDEPAASSPDKNNGMRGCWGCLILIGVIVATVLIRGFYSDRVSAYSLEIGSHLKSGDLDGTWEAKWNGSQTPARMVIQGKAVTVENFPLVRVSPVARHFSATLTDPFDGPSARFKAIDLEAAGIQERFYLECPWPGEMRLSWRYDRDQDWDTEFRRVAKP